MAELPSLCSPPSKPPLESGALLVKHRKAGRLERLNISSLSPHSDTVLPRYCLPLAVTGDSLLAHQVSIQSRVQPGVPTVGSSRLPASQTTGLGEIRTHVSDLLPLLPPVTLFPKSLSSVRTVSDVLCSTLLIQQTCPKA